MLQMLQIESVKHRKLPSLFFFLKKKKKLTGLFFSSFFFKPKHKHLYRLHPRCRHVYFVPVSCHYLALLAVANWMKWLGGWPRSPSR